MWNIFHSAVEWVKDKVYHYLQKNEKVYNFALNTYLYATEQYVYGKQYINRQYNQHKMIKWTIDSIYKIQSYFIHYKIEPFQNIWCNEMFISQTPKSHKYILNEKYIFYDSYLTTQDKLDDPTVTRIVSRQIAKNSIYVKSFIYFKNNDYIILRNNKMNMIESTNNIAYRYIPTSYRFISVEYIYKNCCVTLNLPKSIYIVDNILMTPEFILRCLTYQKEPFVFDYDYTLKIVDHNINIIELKSNQYILLEKNTYKVVLLS